MTRTLLIPYLTLGYPSLRATPGLVRACLAGGADAVELGIPWSDPVADGPTIQESSRRALLGGTTPADAFRVAERLPGAPLLLMTYLNPVLQFPAAAFFRRAAETGIRGIVIPDLPPDEPEGRGSKVPLIPLCAPTCSDGRLRSIGGSSRSFVYLVSRAGVTGERRGLPADLPAFVRRARRLTRRPLCVGFGVSTPAQAAAVARIADGVIVGSAIVRRSRSPREVERFVKSLRRAVDGA